MVTGEQWVDGDLCGQILESLVRDFQVALLVVAPPAQVLKRTEAAARLVMKWFSPEETTSSGVPRVLLQELGSLQQEAAERTWEWKRAGEALTVTVTPLWRSQGGLCWQLKLQETHPSMLMAWLTRLTPREARVVQFLIQGKSDKDIARAAGCEVGTVKKHLQSIYAKTETRGRADFIARALGRP